MKERWKRCFYAGKEYVVLMNLILLVVQDIFKGGVCLKSTMFLASAETSSSTVEPAAHSQTEANTKQ